MVRKVFTSVALMTALCLMATLAWAGAFEQGMALFDKEQYKSAATYFETALNENPDNINALKRLGDCYFSLYSEEQPGYAQQAILAYNQALEKDPNDGSVRYSLALIYSWIDDKDNAIEQLKKLLKSEPDNTKALVELAEIYSWSMESYDKAITTCSQVLAIEKNNKRAQLLMARVLSWKGEHVKALDYYEGILEQDPENDKVRLEYANALSVAGRYDEALMQFNYLAGREDYQDQSLIGLAEAYYYARRFTDASTVCDIILKKDPKNAYAWRLKGLILTEQRILNEAVEAFKKAIELKPDDLKARLFLARAYAMNEGTYPEAITAYNEVLNIEPDNIEVRTELARLYSEGNNHRRAMEQYEYLLKKDPKNNKVRAQMVRAMIHAKNYDEAIKQCQTILKTEPDGLNYRMLYVEALTEAGKFDDAMDICDDILDDHPNELSAMIQMGWIHHQKSMTKIARAEELEALFKTNSLSFFPRIEWLLVRMSEIWHFNRAVAILGDAVKAHPDAVEPYMKLAEVYAQHKAYKSAVESYEAALKIDPRTIDAYLGMAWVYNEMEDHQKSIDAIRRAAQIDPSNVEVLGGLGEAYAYQQDVSQAIEALERAVTLKFSDLDMHRRLAHLYSQNRKYYGKCIQECEYILNQDPDDDEIRLLMARVLSWKEDYDKSLVLYEEYLQRKGHDQDIYLEMIQVKIYSARADEVVMDLKHALDEKPDDLDTRLALAQAYEAQKNHDLAMKEYLMVLKEEPKNAHAHLGLAAMYREAGEYDRAVVEYREVLATNPDSAQAYYGLGVIDRKNGRYERAVAMQKKVLELDPSNVNALAELSYNHYLMSRQYISFSGQYHRAWWLLSNTWGDVYGLFNEYPANIEQMKGILEDDPGNCDIRFLLAQQLQEHNKKSEAIAEYRKLLRYCPNHIGARVALTDIFSVSPATYAYAIFQTEEILKQEPDDFDAHLRLARLYAWSLQYNNSIAHYAWCLGKEPESVDVRYELAQTLTYARRYQEASNQYSIILSQDPNRDDVRMELAKLYMYSDRTEQAIREYEVLLQRNPNHYEAGMALANIYSWDRRYYHRAVDLYRTLFLKYPKNFEAKIEYGRMLYEMGEFKDAEQAYRAAIELDPNNVDAHLMLGRIYISQRDNPAAISEFNKVLQLKSDHPDAHFHLAQMYANSESTWDQAIEHGLLVLEADPKNDEIREMLARVYSAREEYDQAAKHYHILAENNPDDYEYLYQYALHLSYAGQYTKAIEQFQKLVEKDPNDTKVRLEMGMAFLAMGQYTDAIANLEFVTEQDPWEIRARYGLARSFKKNGQVNDAIREYKRILVINPTDKEAIEYLAKYNIHYEDALLDEWFDYPGKKVLASAAGWEVPAPSLVMDEAEQRFRVRLAEEHMIHNRVKRARYQYERLVKADPGNPYYHLSLANIYAQLNMYSSAKREYNRVLQLEPGSEPAKQGLAKVEYESSPSVSVFVGVEDAKRFGDQVSSVNVGSRFTYRFWDGSEAFGELTGAEHTQSGENSIERMSAKVGLKLGVFGEVNIRGEYTYNAYSRNLDSSHNYLGEIGTNIYDYVGLRGYYYRDDIRQTVTAMEEGVGQDNIGGAVTIWPIRRLTFRGEYRRSRQDSTENVDKNASTMANGGVGYTFFNNPYMVVGYNYTYLSYDDSTPNQDPDKPVYWAPSKYQGHSLPVEMMHDVTPDLYYHMGVIPTYSVIENGDDSVGLTFLGGFYWQMVVKHQLAFDASLGVGLQAADYYEYMFLLTYTYIFGNHTGDW